VRDDWISYLIVKTSTVVVNSGGLKAIHLINGKHFRLLSRPFPGWILDIFKGCQRLVRGLSIKRLKRVKEILKDIK
jgi:hypothetical protein